ncbi:MAG: hypothetical protein KGD63_08255 [Candidatus Lokiarchaeota archaeon]|nr:hypothetical protein [Candidatus Lokiarchaeota archaeon]
MNYPFLKRKYKLFTIGVFTEFLDLYGAILHNTWHYIYFRTLWSVITLILLLTSAALIYYGIGRDLHIIKQD